MCLRRVTGCTFLPSDLTAFAVYTSDLREKLSQRASCSRNGGFAEGSVKGLLGYPPFIVPLNVFYFKMEKECSCYLLCLCLSPLQKDVGRRLLASCHGDGCRAAAPGCLLKQPQFSFLQNSK